MRSTPVWNCVAGVCLSCVANAQAADPQALQDAYWRFEEGAVGQPVSPSGDEGCIVDFTGNGNAMRRGEDATAPVYTAEVPAAAVPSTQEPNTLALQFDGAARYIYTAAAAINNPVTTAITIELSFKADQVGNDVWQAMLVKDSRGDDALSEAPILALMLRGDGRLVFQFRDGANQLRDLRSSQPLEAGRWYHAAAVVTADQGRLYLNAGDAGGYAQLGVVAIEGGRPLYEGPDSSGYDSSWTVGRGMWSRTPMFYFAGAIDEVRISNRAFPPAEFLWAQPVPADLDGDLDVDATDLLAFQNCLTGPDLPYAGAWPALCTLAADAQGLIAADVDRDADVDQEDFARIQRCYAGAGVTVRADCHQ